ncbi:Cj0814 family flagellar-dependent secreted protein, partial [Campylobacter estrildidarum]
NKVLGYEVDKDGYFTSEFNKAAGIPEDIKIHSSTMESLVRVWTKKGLDSTFESIDIAKTIGNAYKILSQVVGEDVLNSKDSFTLDEIAKFPQGYEYNRQSMEVTKIYNSAQDFLNGEMNFDYDNKTDTKIESLFFNSYENTMKAKPAIDIFNNNNGGKENVITGVFFDTTSSKYRNPDGTITKGGLLVAIVNQNLYTVEGETTRWGKRTGFDKSMSEEEVRKAMNSFNLKLSDEVVVQGAEINDIDT